MVLGLFNKKSDSPPDKLLGKDKKELPGYLNASAGEGRPVLLAVHDWFGLTPQMRGLVDRFAAAGFITFAPDLYRGKVATDVPSAERLNQALLWPRADLDLLTAVEALLGRNPNSKVGLVGLAMGGAIALHAAIGRPAISAVVTFYGIPKEGKLNKLKARVQGHFGRRDTRCHPGRVSEFEAALTQGRVKAELHRYDAGNGFFHEEKTPAYSAQDAALAWERTIQFLRSALG